MITIEFVGGPLDGETAYIPEDLMDIQVSKIYYQDDLPEDLEHLEQQGTYLPTDDYTVWKWNEDLPEEYS